MRKYVLVLIFPIFFFSTLLNPLFATPIDISPKLDFDETPPKPSADKLTYSSGDREIVTVIHHDNGDRKSSSRIQEKVNVVCGKTGCNVTEDESSGRGTSNNKDPIQTDILVHIQANVDSHSGSSSSSSSYRKQSSSSTYHHRPSEPIEDIPDIPVFVGVDSSRDRTTSTTKRPSTYVSRHYQRPSSGGRTTTTPRTIITGTLGYAPRYNSGNDQLEPNYIYRVYKLPPGYEGSSSTPATTYNNKKTHQPTVSVHLIEGELLRDDISDSELLLPYFPPNTYYDGQTPTHLPSQVLWYPPDRTAFNSAYNRGDNNQRPPSHFSSLQTSSYVNHPSTENGKNCPCAQEPPQKNTNDRTGGRAPSTTRYSTGSRSRYTEKPPVKIDDKIDKSILT